MKKFIENNTGAIVLGGVGLYAIFALKGLFTTDLPDTHKDNMKNVLGLYDKDTEVKKALTVRVQLEADEIQKAIYGNFGFGTDEQTIFKIMDSFKTAVGVKALFLAYGERYTGGSFIHTGFYKVNIVMALKNALSLKDWQRIEPKFKMAGLV